MLPRACLSGKRFSFNLLTRARARATWPNTRCLRCHRPAGRRHRPLLTDARDRNRVAGQQAKARRQTHEEGVRIRGTCRRGPCLSTHPRSARPDLQHSGSPTHLPAFSQASKDDGRAARPVFAAEARLRPRGDRGPEAPPSRRHRGPAVPPSSTPRRRAVIDAPPSRRQASSRP